MKKLLILSIACMFLGAVYSQSNSKNNCTGSNSTFSAGEVSSYVISYNWLLVFSEVGHVSFFIEEDNIQGQKAIHYSAHGKTFSWWDNFFKVRDRYEVWVREDNLRPLIFERNNREGNFKQHETFTYEEDSLIYRRNKVNSRSTGYDTIKINGCTFDVMSALLYTRTLDFDSYKKGDKIPISIALDDEVYDLYFRYLGIDDIKLKGLGTFECMKFTVLLVEGTIFHEGEDLLIWVTNDKNHIPVYVESPILVGSVKARLYDIKGNKYPLTSKKN